MKDSQYTVCTHAIHGTLQIGKFQEASSTSKTYLLALEDSNWWDIDRYSFVKLLIALITTYSNNTRLRYKEAVKNKWSQGNQYCSITWLLVQNKDAHRNTVKRSIIYIYRYIHNVYRSTVYSQDGGLPRAFATSTMLTMTVLMPFPLPSTCNNDNNDKSNQ